MRHLLAMTLFGSVVLGLAGAEPEKPLDVKHIMQKANKPTGIYFNLKKDLEDEEPMWTEMRAEARELAQLAAALGKQTPPKGDKASWRKLSGAYADNAKALDRAVAKQDKKTARAALARMGGDACKTCHKAHRSTSD